MRAKKKRKKKDRSNKSNISDECFFLFATF